MEYSVSDNGAENYDSDIVNNIVEHMNNFFYDKTLSCGAKISDDLLYTKENIYLVRYCRMADEGIELFYKTYSDMFESGNDLKLLLSIHRQCFKRKIPKENVSGIALIYLKHCVNLPRKNTSMLS